MMSTDADLTKFAEPRMTTAAPVMGDTRAPIGALEFSVTVLPHLDALHSRNPLTDQFKHFSLQLAQGRPVLATFL